MIRLRPFQDNAEKIKIESRCEVMGGILTLVFSIEDLQRLIQDFYPIETHTEKIGIIYPAENLWQTTCFEIFLKNKQFPSYYEFNFNSSGDWNLFYFSNYRERVKNFSHSVKIKMSTQMINDKIQLRYILDLKELAHLKFPCQANLASVIREKSKISYWSQKHNKKTPDFHDPENFSLQLDINGLLSNV